MFWFIFPIIPHKEVNMFDVIKGLSEYGLMVFGVVIVSLTVTFIVFTGIMVIFLLFKQVFFPKKASGSLQYTLGKQLVTSLVGPHVKSAIEDFSVFVLKTINTTSKKMDVDKNKKAVGDDEFDKKEDSKQKKSDNVH